VLCGKDNNLMEMRDGKPTPAVNTVTLENGMTIKTNCMAYTKAGEKIDKLRVGDGLLIDGTSAARMVKGKVLLPAPDRAPTPLAKSISMMNGTLVQADGTVVKPDGTKRKLQEHEAVGASGLIGAQGSK